MAGYRITAKDFAMFVLSAEHVTASTMKFRDLKEGVKDVHNWAARGLLTYQPKTDEVRQPRYSLATMIEVSCIGELSRAGYGVKQAAKIARLAVDRAKHLAASPATDAKYDNALQDLGWTYPEGPFVVFSFKFNGDVMHGYHPRNAPLSDLFPQEFGQVMSPFNRHVFDVDYLIWGSCESYACLMAERAEDPAYFNQLSDASQKRSRKK